MVIGEGIGNIHGFFYEPIHKPFSIYSEIICFRKNGIIIYEDPVPEADCDTIFSGTDNLHILESSCSIFPNPVTVGKEFKVICNNFMLNSKIEIRNIQGSFIDSRKVSPSEKSISFLVNYPGIYLLFLHSENTTTLINKFIVVS